jgi:sugar lactone lactonase YvrE
VGAERVALVRGKALELLDLASGSLTRLGELGGETRGLAVSPDGAHLFVRGDTPARLWPAAGGAPRVLAPQASTAAAFSADARWLAFADRGGVRLVPLAGGEERAVADLAGLSSLALSHDGSRLYASRRTDHLVVDVASGDRITLPPRSSYYRQPAVLSPDGASVRLRRRREGCVIFDLATRRRPAPGGPHAGGARAGLLAGRRAAGEHR